MKLYSAKSSVKRAAKKEGLTEDQYEIIEQDGKFGYKLKQEPKIEITRKSSIERPTKAVWDIAEELTEKDPSIRRKDVIAECVARGIAYYTARTQYQQWLTATRNSK